MEITNRVAHKSKSKCKNCGKEIFYDDNDGYWDSLEEEGGRKVWTFLCDMYKKDSNWHEPKNIYRNKNGECFWK